MGAALDLIRNAARTLEIEANAVSDNPLLFGDERSVRRQFPRPAGRLRGRHAGDGAVRDRLDLGAAAAVLVDPKMSGLPPFLIEDSGVNSGFMIAQVTAAALVSENKSLAFPASVDTIPTSASQEDHVSMATHGALKARRIAHNAAGVIGIELLAARRAWISMRR